MQAEIVSDGHDVFIVVDGVKIAKRGKPRTPQAKTWISLEPGWDPNEIEVRFEGVRVH